MESQSYTIFSTIINNYVIKIRAKSNISQFTMTFMTKDFSITQTPLLNDKILWMTKIITRKNSYIISYHGNNDITTIFA